MAAPIRGNSRILSPAAIFWGWNAPNQISAGASPKTPLDDAPQPPNPTSQFRSTPLVSGCLAVPHFETVWRLLLKLNWAIPTTTGSLSQLRIQRMYQSLSEVPQLISKHISDSFTHKTQLNNFISHNKLVDWLIDWGLMALSTQIGYITPLISMLQIKKWN